MFNLAHSSADRPASGRRPTFEDAVEVADVSFRHPQQEGQFGLEHISFTVRWGHSIALVGQSGSGKSTVIDLV